MMSYKGVVRYSEEFTEAAEYDGELASQDHGITSTCRCCSRQPRKIIRWLNGDAGCGSGVYTR